MNKGSWGKVRAFFDVMTEETQIEYYEYTKNGGRAFRDFFNEDSSNLKLMPKV